MRHLIPALVVLAGNVASAQPAKPPRVTACVIVNGPNGNNLPFELATELAKTDKEATREYATAEKGTHDGATFYLRHGHGVARLEGWVGGKRVAMTFMQTGHGATDILSLEVRTASGRYVEAACNDAIKLHGL